MCFFPPDSNPDTSAQHPADPVLNPDTGSGTSLVTRVFYCELCCIFIA